MDIAYQVLGDGPVDFVVLPGPLLPIDSIDAEPSLYRFHRRLASFSRLIRFDQRGTGLSSHVPSSDPLGPARWAEDAIAVMDAVGCEKATIFGSGLTAMSGLVLAADYPERVRSLVIVNGAARVLWAPDYEVGARLSTANPFTTVAIDPDAVEQGFDVLSVVAPSVASDQAFRAWWDSAGNRAASPSMARAVTQAIADSDVRDKLAHITAPTLILHRKDSPFVRFAHGRYLAEHIGGSRYVELPGADALHFVGDTGALLDEIEEFITGVRSGFDAERVLTTIVFTDIVGSTQRAAELGDLRWHDLLDNHDKIVRHQLGGSAVAKSTRQATDSSRRSPVPASRSTVRTRSSTRSARSASRCGPVFTPARSRCAAPTSQAWPCTSAPESRRLPARARCWCRRRCARSSPGHGARSPNAVSTNSRASPVAGGCIPWCANRTRSGGSRGAAVRQ